MNRFLITGIALLLTTGIAEARQLTPKEALAKALSQLKYSNTKSKGSSNAAKSNRMNALTAELQTMEKSTDDTPLCYVFSTSEGGYIITSADDRARTVLGYVSDCTYEQSMQIPAFRDWMNGCCKVLTWLSCQPESNSLSEPSSKTTSTSQEEYVEPLLGDIKWNQTAIYNGMCPIDSATQQRCATGCFATSVSQVMRYWKWPKQGKGIHKNIHSNDPSQNVDFSNSVYDWDNMLPSYDDSTKTYTQEQEDAVAKLMADIGCSLDMLYGSSSAADDVAAMDALPVYFRYSKSLKFHRSEDYTQTEWSQLIKSELNARRPVLMGAATYKMSGHAFVIDGYNAEGLFHVNWGWGGISDNYFAIDVMNPDAQGTGGILGGYCSGQSIYTGLQPDTAQVSEPVHDLRIAGTIKYNKQQDLVYMSVDNTTCAQFAGKICVQMVNNNDEVIAEKEFDYSQNPLYGARLDSVYLSGLAQYNPAEGYKVRPVYYQAGSTEAKIVPSTPCMDSWLTYINGTWRYANAPGAEVVNIDTLLTCLYNPPKFKVTFKCPETYAKGVNSPVWAYIYQNGTICCLDSKTLHIPVGETQEVEFDCDKNTGVYTARNYKQLRKGTTVLKIVIRFNGVDNEYECCSDTFNMKTNKLIHLELEEASIDKSTYSVGDSIYANVKVLNTGGYYENNIYLEVYKSNKSVSRQEKLLMCDTESTQDVFLSNIVPSIPGEYRCRFAIDTATSEDCYFTVVDPSTGISDIQQPNGKSSASVSKYLRKGKLIICKGNQQYTATGQMIR